jgi:Fe-S oxidoreductase
MRSSRGSVRPEHSGRRANRAPEVVFYTGCNVLKTPHIALLALDILDALDVSYQVLGGPSHCCGVVQMRTGDIASSGRFGESTMDKLAKSKSGKVLAWCPTCFVQFNEFALPTIERAGGTGPFGWRRSAVPG